MANNFQLNPTLSNASEERVLERFGLFLSSPYQHERKIQVKPQVVGYISKDLKLKDIDATS